MSKRKTTEDFVNSAIIMHGGKYDYTMVDYLNARTKVSIICPEHGIFEQLPRQHINGHNCPKCSGKYMDTEYFIAKSVDMHNDLYDYTNVRYQNNLTDVLIVCPTHGEFQQKPKHHLLGKGCPKCGGKHIDTESFITKSKVIHKNKYDYSDVDYVKSIDKVIIICPKHGEFNQTPNSHLNGRGCPRCKESKGERMVRLFLEKHNLRYIPQHTFDNCRNIKPLPFDFYLPEVNACIEYNGVQHYKMVKHFGGDIKFRKTKTNDRIKFDYCMSNNIDLIILNKCNIDKLQKLFSYPPIF